MATTKLLLSLPTTEAAQEYYGSHASTTNKVGDAGVDLPCVHPYAINKTIAGQTFFMNTETVFAMYETNYTGIFSNLTEFRKIVGLRNFWEDVTVHADLKLLLSTSSLIPLSFYIAPRSSISKTPFRLANSIGIIDSGYKGYTEEKQDCIGAMFDFHPQLFDEARHERLIRPG